MAAYRLQRCADDVATDWDERNDAPNDGIQSPNANGYGIHGTAGSIWSAATAVQIEECGDRVEAVVVLLKNDLFPVYISA